MAEESTSIFPTYSKIECHYKVIPERGPQGYGKLFFSPLEERKGRENIYRLFSEKGLNDKDLIAEIIYFYPNGRCDERLPEYMRRRVGTALLTKMVEDALNNNAKAMWIFTTRPSMKQFLSKKGFSNFQNEPSFGGNVYYHTHLNDLLTFIK